MSSLIGGMKNVKIFVLYLMANLRRPMDFITLNDIVMQTDYVMYLDFAEAFHKMLDDGLIEKTGERDGDALYDITAKGKMVADELHGDILHSMLDKSLTAALRYLDFKAQGIEAKCESRRREDGYYDFSCSLLEHGKPIFSVSLVVDTAARAEQLKENFRDRPEVIYRGVHAMLAGKANYLFD